MKKRIACKQLFIGTYFTFLPLILFPQSKAIDSLTQLLKNATADTTRMDLHFSLYLGFSDYDLDQAKYHLEEAYKLAKTKDSEFYTAYYFLSKGGLYFDMAKYDESRRSFDSALLLYDQLLKSATTGKQIKSYKLGKVDCLIGKGLLSAKLYFFQESIQYYLQAIASMDDINGPEKNHRLLNLYSNISSDYYELEEFEQALKYDRMGLAYVNPDYDIDGYIISHLFVADDFSGLSQFDSSFIYLNKVRQIVKRLDKPNLNVRFYIILGGIYRKKKEWSKALASFQESKKASETIKDEAQLMSSMEGMAACYLNLGNIPKARELATLSLQKSIGVNVPLVKVQSLQLLTELEEKSGNIQQAFNYQKQLIQVSDSMKKEKIERQMGETEAKYQNEKKEKEILQLQKDNALQSLSLQKKSAFNYFLIGSVVALLVTGFLGFRNLRHRQQLAKQRDELQQQRIRELEKDKQLVAVDSLLKGQEEERSRMAKDLHDGLGGMLSGVKLSLGSMKGNIILSEENTRLFARVLDQLDHSINEMRRVAHNMMPEALVKLGLQQAIQDYCDGLNESNLFRFTIQFHGLETRVEAATEIVIYRIVQELLNNVVKHAEATEVLVQVMRHDNNLTITIEDNGKGFDANDTRSKGNGLSNVRSRVDYLKGQMDIQSSPGNGTSIHIDFTIQES